MYTITAEMARAIVALWCELDKYLYFGLEYCDGESIKALHTRLQPLIEREELDKVC